ncbi:MAG: ABC transporter ATP-binding protein [Lentisphaerae bacterium]|nr:ABC transporter ATP-binding protein [Lentisphaerota bacterium]
MKSPTAPDNRNTTETETLSPDTAIRIDRVTVRYRLPHERIHTFKEYVIRMLRGQLRMIDHLALRDVSMEVRRGEVLGIVGRNGAGKSTLLKLAARVLQPTEGRIRIRGRVAPLLDVGGGFHPELTGHENIFLNGALLGLSRAEITRRLDSIVEFAELRDCIESPLRTYSSGMIARLGFAIATDVEPDILLIDEILAVGDEKFRAKCAGRIRRFRDAGTTIVLVSHDMHMVRELCGRAVWLNKGRVEGEGTADEIVTLYSRA